MCSSCVVKLHEATQMFMMIDYVRKITVKKYCKYGKYELFEHLFFLFVGTVVLIITATITLTVTTITLTMVVMMATFMTFATVVMIMVTDMAPCIKKTSVLEKTLNKTCAPLTYTI